MAIGMGVGVATTMGTLYADGRNPLTGESRIKNNNTNSNVRTEPKNLAEQLVLDEAKSGQGSAIMTGKINDPQWQGWQKMSHVYYLPNGGRIEVHYWRNPVTGATTGFKFK